jgi:hypothetical protein
MAGSDGLSAWISWQLRIKMFLGLWSRNLEKAPRDEHGHFRNGADLGMAKQLAEAGISQRKPSTTMRKV